MAACVSIIIVYFHVTLFHANKTSFVFSYGNSITCQQTMGNSRTELLKVPCDQYQWLKRVLLPPNLPRVFWHIYI